LQQREFLFVTLSHQAVPHRFYGLYHIYYISFIIIWGLDQFAAFKAPWKQAPVSFPSLDLEMCSPVRKKKLFAQRGPCIGNVVRKVAPDDFSAFSLLGCTIAANCCTQALQVGESKHHSSAMNIMKFEKHAHLAGTRFKGRLQNAKLSLLDCLS